MCLDKFLYAIFCLLSSCIVPDNFDYANTFTLVSASGRRLLWDENLGPCLGRDVFDSFTLLTDYESNVAVSNMHSTRWSAEWAYFADKYAHFRLARMLIYHNLDSLLRQNVLLVISLDENVANICVLDLALRNLNLCTTLVLQPPNRLAFFADN